MLTKVCLNTLDYHLVYLLLQSFSRKLWRESSGGFHTSASTWMTYWSQVSHQKNRWKYLDMVLKRLEETGLRLKKKKCKFMLKSVEYLGHNISADGLHPTKQKVHTITDAPQPHNLSQLWAYLGLVTNYGKFLSNLSSTLAPLYQLLEKQTKWTWGPNQEKAFLTAKAQLTSPCLLVHYDPQQLIILSCDVPPGISSTDISRWFREADCLRVKIPYCCQEKVLPIG